MFDFHQFDRIDCIRPAQVTGFVYMKKTKVLSILLAKIILFMVFPLNRVYAACKPGETPTDFGCLPSEPIPFVQTFYGWGLALISFVAILFMIIGGYFVMTSRGNAEQVARGKSFIFYSIAGILLAVFGFVFIGIIAGDILKIPGFN